MQHVGCGRWYTLCEFITRTLTAFSSAKPQADTPDWNERRPWNEREESDIVGPTQPVQVVCFVRLCFLRAQLTLLLLPPMVQLRQSNGVHPVGGRLWRQQVAQRQFA